MVCGTGAGGLRTGADRHEDSECTWEECDLGVDGLCSVTALTVSYVLMGCGLVVGVDGRGQCHRRGYTAQIYDWRLLACGTGAGRLETGAGRHKDSERTWVECDSIWG
jgi:hypothetical protein